MKKLVLALSALTLLAGSAPSIASTNQCRDKSGKFIKCPAKSTTKAATASAKSTTKATTKSAKSTAKATTTAAAAKPKQCRDAKGKFTKCK